MHVNADLTVAAAIDSGSIAWIPSPIAGVERRMLERDGDEVARATSLVRYAAGSSFAPHTHGAGEEFLVLKGVFSDDTGDFPQAWYVRNPPGSRHVQRSVAGAVIFIKLRQMPAAETAPVRLDTQDPSLWHDHGAGCRQALLFDTPWERVVMQRLAPGYQGAREGWAGGAEFFVLAGELQLDAATQRAGAWIRLPAGSCAILASRSGALLYRKTGHLG